MASVADARRVVAEASQGDGLRMGKRRRAAQGGLGCRVRGLGFRVYPTGSFPGMVFSGIYRVSLFLCFSLKGFRRVLRV